MNGGAISISFMQSPLVQWVQTFSAEQLTYSELSDGIFLNEVLQQIDSNASLDGVITHVQSVTDRTNNWEILLRNVLAFYKDILQELVIMKPPDLYIVCTQPESERGQQEMSTMLLFLLGAAVHCEEKAQFVEKIKDLLDVNTQHQIVAAIQQLSQSLFSLDAPSDELDDVTALLYGHVCSLLVQRDAYLWEVKSLHDAVNQSLEIQHTSLLHCDVNATHRLSPLRDCSHSPGGNSGSTPPDRHHLVVELAENRSKIRKLRQEVEDRSDTIAELQEELEALKQSTQKLRSENLDLVQEARSAKFYRDELDVLRDKVFHANRLETELQRCKERLLELDFYKARVDEMRADNDVLLENRRLLEDQLSGCQQRIEAVVNLEAQLQQYSKHISDLTEERENSRTEIASLLEENASLVDEIKRINEGREKGAEDDDILMAHHKGTSLSQQLCESSNSQILRLELDNRRLKAELDALRGNELMGNVNVRLEIDKENARLSRKVEEAMDSYAHEAQRCAELEKDCEELKRAKKAVEEMLDVVRENTSRQVRELEQEKEQMAQSIETLRSRNEKTADARTRDIEKENNALRESVSLFTARAAHAETNCSALQQKCAEISASSSERIKSMEAECTRAIADLQARLETARSEYSQLKTETASLLAERNPLLRTVEEMHQQVADSLKEVDEKSTAVIQLQATADEWKRKAAEADATNLSISQNHEEARTASRADRLKCTQMEHEVVLLTSECRRLENESSASVQQLEALQRSLLDAESKNTELMCRLDGAKEQLEQERNWAREKEDEGKRLRAEKVNIEKENRKLRHAIQAGEEKVEELNGKLRESERDGRVIAGLEERNKEMQERLDELEKESLSLIQQSTIDKNTLSVLREDLVKEKIHCQQIKDELDSAKHQARSFEAAQEMKRSLLSGLSHDDSTIKTLETRMEQVFQKRIDNQEETIHGLEKELEELKSNNVRLENELQYQRSLNLQGTSVDTSSSHNNVDKTLYVTQRYTQSPGATQQILQLKDQLVNIEKANAALQAENRSLREQQLLTPSNFVVSPQSNTLICKSTASINSHSSEQQCDGKELSVGTQSPQKIVLRYEAVQSQLARLQVEKTTLSTQNASLTAQNTMLQNDCSRLDIELQNALQRLDNVTSAADRQEGEHDSLQRLHSQLARDYDTLLANHSELKTSQKLLKAELRTLHEQNSELMHERHAVHQLREALDKENKESLRNDAIGYGGLKTDYFRGREENLRLLVANDTLKRDVAELGADLRRSQMEGNKLRETCDELRNKVDEYAGNLNSAQIELAKLLSHCEILAPMNVRLEEENRSLMLQLRGLMSQNQDLLTNLLASKDRFAEDQRIYRERLSDMTQQKDNLEEKIQSQNKRYDPVKKKNSSFRANLMKKARQIVNGRGKEKVPAPDSATDNSSLGSDFIPDKSTDNVSFFIEKPATVGAQYDTDREWKNSGIRNLARNSLVIPKTRSVHLIDTAGQTNSTEEDKEEEDDGEITLAQFLSECNMSPKSRRRLMVEKQVKLDDGKTDQSCFKIGQGIDALGPNLPPRSPTIQLDPLLGLMTPRRENQLASSRLIAQSDWNIASPRPQDKNKGPSNGVRPKIERSVSYVTDPRETRNFKSLPRSNQKKNLLMTVDKNSPISGSGAIYVTDPTKARQLSVTAGYADIMGGVSVNCYTASPRVGAVNLTPTLNSNKPNRQATKTNRDGSDSQIQSERQYESRPLIERQSLNQKQSQQTQILPVRNSQTPSRKVQHYIEPDSDTVQSTDSGIMSQSNDGAMTSQYNPRNVRNLVQSYQDTVKPTHQQQQPTAQRPRSTLEQPHAAKQQSQQSVQPQNRSSHGQSIAAVDPGSSQRRSRPVSAGPASSANNSIYSLPGEDLSMDSYGGEGVGEDGDKQVLRDTNEQYCRPVPIRFVPAPCVPLPMTSRPLPARPMSTTAVSSGSISLAWPSDSPGSSDRREVTLGSFKPDGNICVVRPASGRTLPQTPNGIALCSSATNNGNSCTAYTDRDDRDEYSRRPTRRSNGVESNTSGVNTVSSIAVVTFSSSKSMSGMNARVNTSDAAQSSNTQTVAMSLPPRLVLSSNQTHSPLSPDTSTVQSSGKTKVSEQPGKPKVYHDYGCL